MAKNSKIDARERLLVEGARLFSTKGFAATGVREVAAAADVNIAMISYYYGSKTGLLKAIIDEFFTHYFKIFTDSNMESMPFEDRIRTLCRGLVNLARTRNHLCRVGVYELPYDHPEIAEYKGGKIRQIIQLARKTIFGEFADRVDMPLLGTIGPALLSMIFSNFMLGPIVHNAAGLEFDDNFYRKYSEIISTLFLNGVTGVIKNEIGEDIF